MIDPRDIRVGEAEREEALRALGEHMSAGRLDLDEYGERTAKVSTAKTFRDLLEPFKDLPQPRPHVPEPPVPAPGGSRSAEGAPRWQNRPLAQRVFSALVPLSAIVAVLLFFTVTKVWFVFLLPAVIMVLGGTIFGDDWNRDRNDWHRHKRNRRRNRWNS